MSASLGRHAHQAVKLDLALKCQWYPMPKYSQKHTGMTAKTISHRGRYMSGLRFTHFDLTTSDNDAAPAQVVDIPPIFDLLDPR